MLRLWLKIGPAVFVYSVWPVLAAGALAGKAGGLGAHMLHTLAGIGVLAAVTVLIPLWVARRRGTPPDARDAGLIEFACFAGAFASPTLVALPLLAVFYLGCLPAGAVELTNRLASDAVLGLFVWFQVVVAAALCWLLWRAGRPDPGAPRRCGSNLEDGAALISPAGPAQCAEKARDEPGAGRGGGWARMLKPWLAIALAILMAGAVLGTAPWLRDLLGDDEIEFLDPNATIAAISAVGAARDLQFLGSLYATFMALSVLQLAHRRDRPPHARELRVVVRFLGAIAAPAVIILLLLAALDLGCLPPLVLQVADQWWGVAMVSLPVYCLALDGSLTCWVEWRKRRPDPDAPRCPRCGYSLKGGTGLGCPECGWEHAMR
jgi:hypothetical protein